MASFVLGLLAALFSLLGFHHAVPVPYTKSQPELTKIGASLPATTSTEPELDRSSTYSDSQRASLAHTFVDADLRLQIDLAMGYDAFTSPNRTYPYEEIIITAPDGQHVYINTSDAPDNGSTPTQTTLLIDADGSTRFSYLLGVNSETLNLAQELFGLYFPNDKIGESEVIFEHQNIIYEISAIHGNSDVLRIAHAIKFY